MHRSHKPMIVGSSPTASTWTEKGEKENQINLIYALLVMTTDVMIAGADAIVP